MTIWTEIANIASGSGDAGLAELKNLLAGLSARTRRADSLAVRRMKKLALFDVSKDG